MMRTRTDVITAEIIRHGLVAITDEMKTNLMRTAYNMVIYEALDYTVGLFDADGNTISIGLGLPMFIRGLSDTVKAKLAHFGHDGIRPGDVLLTNDAYITGSHLNHLVFTLPIFYDDQLVAFASTMAHWQDVGGTIAGITTDIYQEGLQLPILKVYEEGQVDQKIVDIIRTNVRLPDLAMGDFRAQIAAIQTGERRMLQLLRRNGRETVLESIEQTMRHSEAEAREAVAAMPDGVYEAESYMDDDGVRIGVPIHLRVKVTVEGDQMTVDLSGVDRQVSGYFNSGETAGRSAAEVAFKCLTSPTTMPINDGSFRPLKVVLPPGRLVSATKPAAMRCWMNPPQTIVDTIFKALAPAIPERVIAGHHADLLAMVAFGVHPRTGRFYIGSGGLPGGGWGATHRQDGMNVVVCLNDGDTHNAPVEATEAKLPLVFEKYELRADSGGAGEFRGGLGCVQVRRVLNETTISSQIDRTKCAPWGLDGGLDGLPNKITLRRGGEEVELPNGKTSQVRLAAGDAYVLHSGGGGGYGDPLDRPVDRVALDIRRGYVSAETAARDYGVVVDPTTLAVDERQTAERRRALRQHRGHPAADGPQS
jgi:N-methylhydantoinase B